MQPGDRNDGLSCRCFANNSSSGSKPERKSGIKLDNGGSYPADPGERLAKVHLPDVPGTSKPYLTKMSRTAAVLMYAKKSCASCLFFADLRTTQACSIGG